MTSYVPAELRRWGETRARLLCEYCLIHSSDTYLGCQVDHIIGEKHGGPTEAGNLTFACTFGNRTKGSDIGSVTETGEYIRFYNPRSDVWSEHFQLNNGNIESLIQIGEATGHAPRAAKILALNDPDRQLERTMLMSIGRYPTPEAVEYMQSTS